MSKAEIVGTVTLSIAGVVNRIKNGLKNNRDSSWVSLQKGFNPLSPNGDQQQFAPNDIHTLS